MELYQLEYFLEVARQRNFTRAAARLHLAQAALSEQIRKLEDELATPLFRRGRRESTLTAAGETLRVHAEVLLERAAAARHAVQELVGLRSGKLVIGAIPSVSAGLLPAAVTAFRKRHPQVELVIAEGTSESVAEGVESGRVEMGVIQHPAPAGPFDERTLLIESFVILSAPHHAIARRRRVSLKSLAGEPFVFFKGRARDSALTACREAGFEPRLACESGELETVRALVAAGLGIALLPELAAQRARPACALVRLNGPPVERQLVVVTRRGHAPSPAATEFEALLRSTRPPGPRAGR
ncbi:MAG TPA: LysR substrate-binding domain-containing protein [Chthoniobacter sp.]|nr:LysR substrate-binding domain-containing protein [Chthoniobacter sp.]